MFKKLLQKFKIKYDEVFFVGATDKLPPPLSKEDELSFLIKAKQGDEKAKDKLIEHNLRLVVFLAKKYESTGYDIEDLIRDTVSHDEFGFEQTAYLLHHSRFCLLQECR